MPNKRIHNSTISIICCSWPLKPYIFWNPIIWWWQWPRQIHTKKQRHRYTLHRHWQRQSQIQSASKTQCIQYFSNEGVQGYQIWRVFPNFPPKIQIQSASKTQCMLYFWKAGGSRISNMAYPTKPFHQKTFHNNFYQTLV